MNYITILDFEAGRVFQYEWPGITSKYKDAGTRCEEYLSRLGHNLANCEWMIHENPQVITNK